MIGRWEFRANEENYKKKQIDAIWDWQINENNAIASEATVSFSELPKTKAKEEGISGNFRDKYPDIVKVYTILDAEGKVWSR